jgi:hypothetical protein
MDDKNEISWGTESKPVFDLKRSNYERWFRHMKLYLMSKSVWWTIETKLSTTATLDSESSRGLSASRHATPVPPGRSFEEDNSKAMLAIVRSLSEDDQELVEEEDTASSFWRVLSQKYQERLMSHARQYLKSYVNFEVTGPIDDAWSQLQTIGRRITAIVPELATLNKPQHRIHVLLGALPSSYQALVDAIDGQPHLTSDQILARLHEKEMTLGIPIPENAMAAKQTKRPPATCYLCDGPHGIQSCDYYDVARDAVLSEKKKDQERLKIGQGKKQDKKAEVNFNEKVNELQVSDLLKRIEKLEHKADAEHGMATVHFDHRLNCQGCLNARRSDKAATATFDHGMDTDYED